MENKQADYKSLIMYIAKSTLKEARDIDGFENLTVKLNEIIRSPPDLIGEPDNWSSDYEHIWSAETYSGFDDRDVMQIVLELSERLSKLDIYSRDALELIYKATKSQPRSWFWVHSNYKPLKVNEAALEYLLVHASTPQESELVKEFKGKH